ncbi:hypothetical protein GQ44DRAFT_727173 [Phaeosphaeriaceae sp. PMI808]|nr:hypothetical protein GQ44DRAFT_727173 [Phaeosphaeriaceae sp. PMI808]
MTSSAMSTPTDTAPPQLFPPAADSDSDSDDPDRNETVFNYYFLFLAAFGALVAVLLWWLHRQRRRRKQQQRLGGQHALARDLQGWTGARRFIHGRYTPYQTAAQTRREEGLDEHGEAPPPYQHKTYIPSDTLPSPRALAIPLRTISRDNNHLVQPPGYSVR